MWKQWQLDLIEKTQPELLSMVICDEIFLSYLVTPGGLTAMDKMSITQLKNSNSDYGAHVGRLLTLLKTRTKGFDLFVFALDHAGLTGALTILRDNAASVGEKIPETPSTTTKASPGNTGSETGGTTPSGSDDASKKYLKLIVGSDDCSYRSIMDVMEDKTINGNLLKKWKRFASKLEIAPEDISQFERQITYRSATTIDVVEDILMSWRSAASENAKLPKLISVMESLDCTAIADKLRKL